MLTFMFFAFALQSQSFFMHTMVKMKHSNTFIMIAALIKPPLQFEAAPQGGGGMIKGGPPF